MVVCDLAYRHMQHYIIEDIIYIDPSNTTTVVVVDISSDGSLFWKEI